MSKKGILRDLLEVLPDPPAAPTWDRFITAFDFIGRYLYGLPDQPERSDEAWEGLLAEAHDEMAEAVALLKEAQAALAATVAEMRAVPVVSEPAPIMPISFPDPVRAAEQLQAEVDLLAQRMIEEALRTGRAAADEPDAPEAPDAPVEAPAPSVAAPVAAPATQAELGSDDPGASESPVELQRRCPYCDRPVGSGPGLASHMRHCAKRPLVVAPDDGQMRTGAMPPSPSETRGRSPVSGQMKRAHDTQEAERAAIREVAQRSLTSGADESRAAAAEFAAKRNAAAKAKADETWAERHPGEVRA